MLLFATWFFGCSTVVFCTQLLGTPLYLLNRNYYYAWMALTKQSYAIVILGVTQWFSPTVMRVSYSAEMTGQFHLSPSGDLITSFPERLILTTNHQVYTDWVYQWWISYTSQQHGHIFIILREDLKYIPILGWGMMFFGFIFMARKWANDKPRLQHRLQKLKERHSGPMSGSAGYDPMWLLIFPEGTNLSANTRRKNDAYVQREHLQNMRHVLLPRSTGLFFCLQQLRGTVEYIYDSTMAYEGISPDDYAQDFFTIRSTYFQGRAPASVNMYWRRFAIAEIPLGDVKEFETWLMARWREKDALLEQYYRTGRFPAIQPVRDKDDGHSAQNSVATNTKGSFSAQNGAAIRKAYIETEVRMNSLLEIGQIFVVLAAFALVVNVLVKLVEMFF